MPVFPNVFGGAGLPRAVQQLLPQQQQPQQPSLQQQAQKAADQAREMLAESARGMKQTSGMVRVCVEGAKIVCDMTDPANKINILKVDQPRSLVEGKRLAQVQDVKRDTNIPAWPCKCKKRPSGSDYLPCDYQPAGVWRPGVQTETNDASNPKNRSDAYKKGYETGRARGLETVQAMRSNPGVMQALQHGVANSNSSFLDLASFAAVESTGNPLAGLGEYRGLMQMGRAAAQDVGIPYSSMIGGSQAAMNNNVLGGARYMDINRSMLPPGQQVGPSDLYLMHQQGAGGYGDMMDTIARNPNAPLTSAQADQAVDGINNQGDFKDYFDGKFDGAKDSMKDAFPKESASSGSPKLMAIPETAIHKCTYGGTIRIVDPGQQTKRAKLGGASMKP